MRMSTPFLPKRIFLLTGLLSAILVFGYNISSQSTSKPLKSTDNYRHVKGVIHLQTPVSGGRRTNEDYIKLAKENGVDILIVTDHDNLTYEYSIDAFRWLVKKKVEKESILTYGFGNYIDRINHCRKSNNDMVMIDGAESSPFYYWAGSAISKRGGSSLIIYNRGKHMLVMGMEDDNLYEKMPTIAGGYSKFDAYHGNQKEKPYQDLIDYTINNGGLIFWAHPEAKRKINIKGVSIITDSYEQSLLDTYNYTGFSV